jgi:hypothetical protein
MTAKVGKSKRSPLSGNTHPASGAPASAFQPDIVVASVEPQSLSPTTLLFYAITLCAVGFTYSAITNHIWEDAMITLRSAENLVNGHGLTYQVGTRIHTFTSPINVLLLALSYFLTGKGSYVATLWAYRVFSIAAFALSGVLLLQTVARAAPRWSLALWWLAIVYLFDGKSVVFSANGMETAFMLLFVAWAIYLISTPDASRWLARGLCWAGLMWSRPDGCVYIAALVSAELLFSGVDRRVLLRSFAKSAAIGFVVYGPWFFWAWSYYGTPVPNTVIAKSNPEGAIAQFWEMVDHSPERFLAVAASIFRNVQSVFGFVLENAASRRLSDIVTKCLGIFCTIYWLSPVKDRLGKIASFCFAFLCVYFTYQARTANWYLPPATLLGFVTLERAIATFVASNALSERRTFIKAASVSFIVFLALGQIIIFVLTTWEMRIQQAEIEIATRSQVGIWLREHGTPTDTVYLEPLGYIGYLSGMTMHDFPGLASPMIVKLRREKGLDFQSLILEVKPDWVVLRPQEFKDLVNSDSGAAFQQRYEMMQMFNAIPRLDKYEDKYGFVPGKSYISADVAFGVFRRKLTSQF